MPRGGLSSSAFMKPFVVLALPGMYLFYKYSQYRRQQQEQNRRKITERELAHLNHKIDKLLTKLEENEPELATSQEDECVICVNAKATMQTSPCGHRVVCRKCFVKTIQMAVSQRLLPLRCVICRAKILRLKQSGGGGVILPHCNSKGWGLQASASSYTVGNSKWLVPGSASSYSMGKAWVPNSASQYSMGVDVPNSESLYSMSSGSSSFSGVSSVSSATSSSQCSSKSGKTSARLGCYPRQPTGSLKKSQTQAMKLRIQEYNEPNSRTPNGREPLERPARLPPIAEFQREYREGKQRTGSSSTRIRCAQKIVTQLETTPLIKPTSSSSSTTFFRSPLKPANIEDKRKTEKRREDKIKEDKKEHDENVDNNKKEEKLNKKLEKKEEKKELVKVEKKELTKAEKKELKKEAKAEKKEQKKEAKAEKKKEKKEAKEAAKAAEKKEK